MTTTWVLGVLGVALLAGCGGPAPQVQAPNCRPGHTVPNQSQLLAELSAAEARWAMTGVRDYQYDESDVGYFPEVQLRWVVRDGQAVSATPLSQWTAPPTDLTRGTMQRLFAKTRRDIQFYATASPPDLCASITVQYDPVDGHITSVDSAYASESERLLITNFTRL